VDKATFLKTLRSGHSVGVIPGGIAEMFEFLGRASPTEVLKLCGRKGFVALALKTGSQLVPCYTFGCWGVFEVCAFPTPSLSHPPSSTDVQLEVSAALLSPHGDPSAALLGPLLPPHPAPHAAPDRGRPVCPILPPPSPPTLPLAYRPIQCPLVEDPSPELINEYHELFMRCPSFRSPVPHLTSRQRDQEHLRQT
jgi:hypothetical protein